MKRYISLFYLATVLLPALFTSCEKDTMTYQGKDAIYFNVRRGAEWIDPELWAHQHFSLVPFGATAENTYALDLSVCVTGMPSDVDRSFSITVVKDSTTLKEGDWVELEPEYVIKAGETKTDVRITFNRAPHMENDTLNIQFALQENEHFSLMFDEFGKAPQWYSPESNPAFDYNKSANVHNVFVFDVMSRPSRWIGIDATGLGLWGRFSAKKWKLMMDLTGTAVEDYDDITTMPDARRMAIAQTCLLYCIDKAEKRTPILDEDGSMMFFFHSSITTPWEPFQTPSDYYGDENWTPYEE